MSGEELGTLMVKGWYSGIWLAIKSFWPQFLVAFILIVLIKILDKKVKAAIKEKKKNQRNRDK